MKLIGLFAASLWITLLAGPAIADTPTAPVLDVDTLGPQLTISWSGSENATGYILYYAPYPDPVPIGTLDMGAETGISGELSLGDSFYLAVEPYNNEGAGEFSNLEYFILAEPKLRLFEKASFSFFNNDGFDERTIPYLCVPSNCSKQSSATIIGTNSRTHGEFKIVAEGKSYKITSISATNVDGNVSASINGLEVGQVIKPNKEVSFTTVSGLTGGAKAVLQWSVEVEGEGVIFTDTISFYEQLI